MEYTVTNSDRAPEHIHEHSRSQFQSNNNVRRLYKGVVLVLFVTLLMTLASLFVTVTLGIFQLGIITTFMFPAIYGHLVANTLEILFCIAWLIMLIPLHNQHGKPYRKSVRILLQMSLWVLIVAAIADYLFFFGNLKPVPATLHLILQLATIIPTLALYPLQLLYIDGIAKLTDNAKTQQRIKIWIWLTPILASILVLLIAFINIHFFWLLIFTVLVVVIQYWNMIEYTRRDLKKIIAARVES